MGGRGAVSPAGMARLKEAERDDAKKVKRSRAQSSGTFKSSSGALGANVISSSEFKSIDPLTFLVSTLEVTIGQGLKVDPANPNYMTIETIFNGNIITATKPGHLNTISKELFGRSLTAQEYSHLMAAPSGSRINIDILENAHEWGYNEAVGEVISINVTHPYYRNQARKIYRNTKGQLELHHAVWELHSHAPKGTGTWVFLGAVNAALKYKVDVITTDAAGNPGELLPDRQSFNGYYTWPRLGYNARLSEEHRAKLPTHLQTACTLNQLFLMKDGAEWWKLNGGSGQMVFSLNPRHSSLKVLSTYLRQKAAQRKQNGD
jgi:hypothetical protein